MQQEPVAWGPTIGWVIVLVCLLAFWVGVGYGISRAFASNTKPEPPHVVCTESPPRPYIGTAIVCFSRP